MAKRKSNSLPAEDDALRSDANQDGTSGNQSDQTEQPSQLNILQRQLYSRDESATLKNRGEDLKRVGVRHTNLPPTEEQADAPTKFKSIIEERAQRRRRWLIWIGMIILLSVLFGAAVGGTLWYRLRRNVTAEQITIELQTKSELTSGDEITYTVNYTNDSYVDWQNVELVFEPPTGFTYLHSSQPVNDDGRKFQLSVGDVDSRKTDSFSVTGRLIGEQSASVIASTTLIMTPENYPSGRFEQAALATTTITAMPIDLSVVIANEARSGERILATIQVTNTSTNPLTDAYLQLMPSAGMTFAPEDPQFTSDFSLTDNEWTLPTIEPRDSVTYEAILFIQGQPSEQRELESRVGVKHGDSRFIQRKVPSIITISASQLSLVQSFNKAASPMAVATGQKVEGIIDYANTGTVGLSDAIIRVKFEGEGIDPASLDLKTGAYDPTTRTISWTASTVPGLALIQPQDTGQISYSFSIKNWADFPITGEQTSNHALIINATVDSPDLTVPVGEERSGASDRFVMSVTTDLALATNAFYDDGRLGLTSTGPLPPQAGDTTSYTIRLQLGSTLNDAGDVRVVAVLPDGVQYTDQKIATVGEVAFNDRSGEVVWTIPILDALTGRTQPTADLLFQVSVTPGENQRGQELDLLNRLVVDATDMFTDSELHAAVEKYPSTETASPGKGKVQ